MRRPVQSVVLFVALVAALIAAPRAGSGQRGGEGLAPTQAHPGELVVLLHGMGRTSRSMHPVQEALEEAGYEVVNLGYSSYCCGIAELGARLRQQLDSLRRPEHHTVHFVGHSLGGILVRWMLAQASPPPGVGRIVMLAPPNQGARSADRFTPFVEWVLEPIDELRTDSTATVRRLPPMRGLTVGVIAGRQDGKVSVEETHVPGETAHLVVDANHAFIMRDDDVIRQTLAFLREGRFTQTATEQR